MVIVRLIGGLGNQLFQYAAGRRLAHARGAELKLDVSHLGKPAFRTPRHYELGSFDVAQAFATEAEVAALTRPRRGWLDRLLGRLLGRPGTPPSSHVKEHHVHFDPAVLNLPDGVYLDGYWQSERYFADVADLLRRELTVAEPPTGRNAELLERIAACHAVSVHVRRGDYLYDEAVRTMHPVCGPDYYERAVAYVAERVSDPVLFVFSDEPEWAKAHLKLPFPTTVVDHNGDKGCEDLRLMRHCAHHVTANSSFSWWGAWLDPAPDKVVVAPERWYGGPQWDTKDLIPAGWVRL